MIPDFLRRFTPPDEAIEGAKNHLAVLAGGLKHMRDRSKKYSDLDDQITKVRDEIATLKVDFDPLDEAKASEISGKESYLAVLYQSTEELRDKLAPHTDEIRGTLRQTQSHVEALTRDLYAQVEDGMTALYRPFYQQEGHARQAARNSDTIRRLAHSRNTAFDLLRDVIEASILARQTLETLIKGEIPWKLTFAKG